LCFQVLVYNEKDHHHCLDYPALRMRKKAAAEPELNHHYQRDSIDRPDHHSKKDDKLDNNDIASHDNDNIEEGDGVQQEL